jgi:glycosyltransferase involved in cell wall biosynthesis
MDLSIIVPACNELPQIRFTIQSLFNELNGLFDFEIIVIDNHTEEVTKQGFPHDGTYEAMVKLSEKAAPYIVPLRLENNLSHWNAKNQAIEVAKSDLLFFCDAHVMLSVGSLRRMFAFYSDHWQTINGSFHLPLSYLNDARGNELIYRLVENVDLGMCHYRFTPYVKHAPNNAPYFPVPCMSTCGMMIHKRLLVDVLGKWPSQLGIYGGGENFLNFVQAAIGMTPHVICGEPLYHYAAPRGYRWNHFDWIRNRIIAIFLAGGENWAISCTDAIIKSGNRGTPRQLYKVLNEVLDNPENQERRKAIENHPDFRPLETWIDQARVSFPALHTHSEEWK